MKHIRLAYQRQDSCPLCGNEGRPAARIEHGTYVFNRVQIEYPAQARKGIEILGCPRCGLWFKRWVPTPEALRDVLQRHAGRLWDTHSYPFENVRALVDAHAHVNGSLDVFDVGSGDGALLRLFADRPGRRSALDVVEDPRCRPVVTGEYVEAFVDEPFSWSGQPYDVVLAFDIFEHLYRPDHALEGLRALVRPGGCLVAQTGDGDYPADASVPLGAWYYLNLFEHHVCWTPAAFRFAARRYGLEVERLERTAHKDAPYVPAWKRTSIRVLRALGRWRPAQRGLVWAVRRDVRNLGEPRAGDHLTVVLRRPAGDGRR